MANPAHPPPHSPPTNDHASLHHISPSLGPRVEKNIYGTSAAGIHTAARRYILSQAAVATVTALPTTCLQCGRVRPTLPSRVARSDARLQRHAENELRSPETSW